MKSKTLLYHSERGTMDDIGVLENYTALTAYSLHYPGWSYSMSSNRHEPSIVYSIDK